MSKMGRPGNGERERERERAQSDENGPEMKKCKNEK